MSDSLERIYRAVPTVQCKGLCTESCGPIDMSPLERQRLKGRGVEFPERGELIDDIVARGTCDCPALEDGRCSVYDDRPLICRLWGAVESMPCPHGCEVTPGLLVDAGAHSLIGRSLKLETPDGC